MPARIPAEPHSDTLIEPENCRDSGRTHRILTLVSTSLVFVGALAAPVDVDRHRGVTVGNLALAQSGDASGEIEVMTLNQALGADLVSLLDQPPDELNAALVNLLECLVATNFPARAERQAKLIARRLPDLIGLQ